MNGAIIPVDDVIYSNDSTPIGYYGNKTLYRMVVNFGAVSADTDTIILNDASIANSDIVSLTGTGKQSDNSIVSLGHYYGTTSYSALWINNSKVYVKSKVALTGGYFTLIYAK